MDKLSRKEKIELFKKLIDMDSKKAADYLEVMITNGEITLAEVEQLLNAAEAAMEKVAKLNQ